MLSHCSDTRDRSVTEVIGQFHRRAHLPIVIASGRLNTPVKVALVERTAASLDGVRHCGDEPKS